MSFSESSDRPARTWWPLPIVGNDCGRQIARPSEGPVTGGSKAAHYVDAFQAVGEPANRLFLMMAWIPQLPSTTWVTPKSTSTEISEIASSSVNPLVFIRKLRILRNASRNARSIEDFL